MMKRFCSLLLLCAFLLFCFAAFAEEQEIIEDELADSVVLDPEEEETFADSDQPDEALAAQLAAVGEMRHILLVGIDARPGQKTGRSDTMIIVTVDPKDNSIKLTSLMRDMYVEIPGKKNNRINASYYFGGPELLLATIKKNFGLEIENYIAVNFSMLGKLIDAIGGLTLTVESDYYKDRINAVIKCDNAVLGIDVSDGLLKEAGEQLMTGKQAQAYARYRYGTKDGDFGRTKRQREVVQKIFESLCTRSAVELMNLVVDNAGNVYTNLSVAELAQLAPVLLAMKDAEFDELRLPIDKGYSSKRISGMSVLVPNRKKNIEALAEFLGK